MSTENPTPEQLQRPDQAQNKYEGLFMEPYQELKRTVRENIKDNDRILDIGCNNGNIEVVIDDSVKGATVYCVDMDQEALSELQKRELDNTDIEVFCSDATEFLQSTDLTDLDLVIISATLHEINTPEDQAGYLDFLLEKLRIALKQKGKGVIADYYYPEHVTDDEIAKYREWQMKEIGHSDPREKFVPPTLIKEKVTELGFTVLDQRQMPAAKEIDRQYIITVFEKV